MSQNLSRRIGAAVIAAGIAFVPVATSIGIAPAVAQETPEKAVDYNKSAPITFTIHKYLQTGAQTPGAINPGGQKLDSDPAGAPLENVKYSVKKITGIKSGQETQFDGVTAADGYDIAKLKGQKNLNAIAKAIQADPTKVEHLELGEAAVSGENKTGSDGTLVFSNDQLKGHGAYLVTEEDTAGAATAAGPVDGSIVKANPFVAFLPITSAVDSDEPVAGTSNGKNQAAHMTFNYNVHAYPKNTSVEAVKTFTNLKKISQAGQQLNYAISADIPGFDKAQGQGLKKYEFKDTLPDQLGFIGDTPDKSLFAVRLTASDGDMPTGDSPQTKRVPKAGNKETFVATVADREVLTVDTDYTVSFSGQEVTVALTPGGLTKMETFKTNHANGKAQLFVPTIVKGAIDNNTTKNTSTVIFNNGNGGGDVENTPATPPGPIYGKVKLTKTNEDGSEKLTGAEFELRWCNADGTFATDTGRDKPINTVAFDNEVTAEEYKTLNKTKKMWVTNQDGEITWQGLQFITTANTVTQNGEVIDVEAVNSEGGKYQYCVHELKAPDGYEKHKDPILLEFNRTDDSVIASLEVGKNVVNIKRSDFSLPGTGGEGVLLYGAAGLALGGLGAGAGAMWLAGRKKRAASEAR